MTVPALDLSDAVRKDKDVREALAVIQVPDILHVQMHQTEDVAYPAFAVKASAVSRRHLYEPDRDTDILQAPP
jgi:hypothetical protein